MKKALITGASSGIGLHFAETLKSQGWEVHGVARSEDKLKATFGDGKYLVADLSSDAGIATTEAHLKSTKYDLLINNAGYGIYGRFDEIDIKAELNMMHLNMDALVRLSHAYLETAVKGDALMNISSALSLLPMPGAAVYSATKSFVTSFTECLWYEYKDKGIYVFADLPGAVSTAFHENAGSKTEAMDAKMVLSPDLVVKEALKALNDRKKPSIVNGGIYRLLTKATQLFSRKMRLEQMAKNSPKL
jgi:uncharacterized protein